MVRTIARLVLGLAAGGCLAPMEDSVPILATAEVADDFESYEIRRVGLLPFAGEGLTDADRQGLQAAFCAEIARFAPYEVVLLGEGDLEAIEKSDPYRRGWYRPRTILSIAQRYQLDAILFGTVTSRRFYRPQSLGMTIDLVAAETGLAIWSSSVYLDAADPRVREGIEAFYRSEDEDTRRVALLSPERFARFAAFQVASLL